MKKTKTANTDRMPTSGWQRSDYFEVKKPEPKERCYLGHPIRNVYVLTHDDWPTSIQAGIDCASRITRGAPTTKRRRRPKSQPQDLGRGKKVPNSRNVYTYEIGDENGWRAQILGSKSDKGQARWQITIQYPGERHIGKFIKGYETRNAAIANVRREIVKEHKLIRTSDGREMIERLRAGKLFYTVVLGGP